MVVIGLAAIAVLPQSQANRSPEAAAVTGVDLDLGAHAGAQRRRADLGLDRGRRNGIRCTTLTQLPLVFCAGSRENWDWLAGLTLCTVPAPLLAGIGVDEDRYRLARGVPRSGRFPSDWPRSS